LTYFLLAVVAVVAHGAVAEAVPAALGLLKPFL